MIKEKIYNVHSTASEYQEGFDKGADLDFSDGKDKGFVDGFESACKAFDIDYPVGITLPSGKEMLVNNFPPSPPNHSDDVDDEDVKEIRDFNEVKDCDLKTSQSKEICCDCGGRYSCDLSPYYVGEYETINILKVQNIIDEFGKVMVNIEAIRQGYKERGEFGIAQDYKDFCDELRPIIQNLHLLQEDLNTEAFYAYLESVRQVNVMNEDIEDYAYMEAYDDGYNQGFKKGYIARLEDEDLEDND